MADAERELLLVLLNDRDTTVTLEQREGGGWQVKVDTSWVELTDEEAELLRELRQ